MGGNIIPSMDKRWRISLIYARINLAKASFAGIMSGYIWPSLQIAFGSPQGCTLSPLGYEGSDPTNGKVLPCKDSDLSLHRGYVSMTPWALAS